MKPSTLRVAIGALVGVLAVGAGVILYLAFPLRPNPVGGLAFEGFIYLPKGPYNGVITVLDYLTIANDHLFVTNESAGLVYDVDLHEPGLPRDATVAFVNVGRTPHGVAIDAPTGLAFVTRSDANKVAVFRSGASSTMKSLSVPDDPDGLFFIPGHRLVYVASGDAKVATLINPATLSAVGKIELGGKPEFGTYDPDADLFYQNLQDIDVIAAVDLRSRRVVAKWSAGLCHAPTGISLDIKRRLLFVGCNESANVIEFSLDKHETLASIDVGSGPDVVAYDPELQRVYATGRAGVLHVIDARREGVLTDIGVVHLRYGAHSLAYDQAQRRLFVGYASFISGPQLAVFSAVRR